MQHWAFVTARPARLQVGLHAMTVMVPPALSKMKVFGLTLAMALSMSTVGRPLSVVELWSGVGSIAKAAQLAGFPQVAMDRGRIPGVTDDDKSEETENIMTKCGFMKALQAVLQLRDGGLLWMAPVCSSFVFMNSVKCQRTVRRPAGDTAYMPVKEGNFMACIAAFLYAVAMLRGAHPVIEQPAGSIMFRYKPLAKVLNTFGHDVVTCARCHFQVNADLGQRFLKRFKFVGEAWVHSLHQKCTCPGGIHKALVMEDANGGVTGDSKLLKESQSYPRLLGKWVVDNWMEQHGLKPTVQQSAVPLSTVKSTRQVWKRPSATGSSGPDSKKQRQANGAQWKRPGATSSLDSAKRQKISMCSSWKRCSL